MGAHDWKLREIDEVDRKRFEAEGWWWNETLGHHLAAGLADHRDSAFVVHSATRPWRGSYGGLLDMSLRVAAGLSDRGVGAGDVVTFQTPNWVEGAVTFYAASIIGAVVAPVVHIYGAHELGYILGECRPRVHVTATRFGRQDYLANLEAAGVEGAEIFVVGDDEALPSGLTPFTELLSNEPLDGPTAVDPMSPALVGWTSGTTSNPKGVIHSHLSVLAEIKQLGATSPPNERSRVIANPISHAIGMLGALLIPLGKGQAVHLLDQWDPAVVLRLMLEENLSAGGGAPYFLTSLLDHPDFTPDHLERLTYQGMGGAPVPRAIGERATELGITMYRAYGSTEHPSITGCHYSDPLDKRLDRDGVPLPGNTIRLVDPDGEDVPVGTPGEIWSKGPELFLGYTDAALTARVFDADGWYHTGDIAVMDEDGYILITDRISDIIIRGGENISAAEVEELLLRMPGVAEVAVVAAPDDRMGEHAAAVFRMVDGPGPGLADVRDYLEGTGLARQKWPEEVQVLEDFPRTASGKIQKFVLRDRLRQR